MFAFTSLFNIVLDILATEIILEGEIKVVQIGKDEIKLSLFADEKISYTENPIESSLKLVNLINEFAM